MRRSLLAAVGVLASAGCTTAPPVPDWQLDAHDSLERASSAYLEGDGRIAAVEFARARAAVAATGRVDLVATVELTRCAAQVASLDLGPCAGFEPLRGDAGPDARAYADHLAARSLPPADIARLPAPQRAVAAAIGEVAAAVAAAAPPSPAAVDLTGIADPLSRLVAAGVLLAAGRADAAVAAAAVATASARGWRRPLLAWLEQQARQADAAGAASEAARLRRRIELVAPAPSAPAPAPAPAQAPAR